MIVSFHIFNNIESMAKILYGDKNKEDIGKIRID